MKDSDHLPRGGSRVTLEDLLKIKRAERPKAEFWSRFDEELRAKQLAAIMHRRTWWQSLPFPSLRTIWVQLPAGAAAAVTLSLLLVHEFHSNSRPVSTQPQFATGAAPAPVAIPAGKIEAASANPTGAGNAAGGSMALASQDILPVEAVAAAIATDETALSAVELMTTRPVPEQERALAASEQLIKSNMPKLMATSQFAQFAGLKQTAIAPAPDVVHTTPRQADFRTASLAKAAIDRLNDPVFGVEMTPTEYEMPYRKEAKPEVEVDRSFRFRPAMGGLTSAPVPRNG